MFENNRENIQQSNPIRLIPYDNLKHPVVAPETSSKLPKYPQIWPYMLGEISLSSSRLTTNILPSRGALSIAEAKGNTNRTWRTGQKGESSRWREGGGGLIGL